MISSLEKNVAQKSGCPMKASSHSGRLLAPRSNGCHPPFSSRAVRARTRLCVWTPQLARSYTLWRQTAGSAYEKRIRTRNTQIGL